MNVLQQLLHSALLAAAAAAVFARELDVASVRGSVHVGNVLLLLLSEAGVVGTSACRG